MTEWLDQTIPIRTKQTFPRKIKYSDIFEAKSFNVYQGTRQEKI